MSTADFSLLSAFLFLSAACYVPPPIPAEPEPDEPEFVMPCTLKVDEEPDVVERQCGKPAFKIYVPDMPEGVVWKYCRGSCRQQFGVVFYNGKLFRWGRAYEVPQQ